MPKNKRVVRHMGEVTRESIAQLTQKPVRWRILQNTKTREIVRFFGYGIGTGGPWVGYPGLKIKEAPCTHCGQLAFGLWGTQAEQATHECPGHLGKDSLGVTVPCGTGEPHECTGLPSMSYHGVYRWTALNNWEEVKS